MPPVGKKPQFFRVRKFLPQNRVQQQRIPLPKLEYRPIRMMRRDVIIRGRLKLRPEWYTLHRRFFPGDRINLQNDPLEDRAMPEWMVKGYLEERIIYKELLKRRFVPGIDFTFQSSAEGGRTELGGIVVDFLLEFHRLIIQVDGPTHQTVIGRARDREQAGVLASMGFTVISIHTDLIHDAGQLEDWFRQHVDPGVVDIQDPFETFTDEVIAYG